MVPAIPVAIISKKRRRVINAFRQAEATRPENSRTLEEIGVSDSNMLELLKPKAIVVGFGPDRYYLNDAQAKKRSRKQGLVLILLLALAVFILWNVFIT